VALSCLFVWLAVDGLFNGPLLTLLLCYLGNTLSSHIQHLEPPDKGWVKRSTNPQSSFFCAPYSDAEHKEVVHALPGYLL
jgi:hypothetical protein